MTLLGAAFAALVIFFSLEPPRVERGVAEPPLLLPAQFETWPAFVLTWQVEDPDRGDRPLSPVSARFGEHPCDSLVERDCYVRLAWGDFARWSLTASSDPVFDDLDPRQLTIGPVHYALVDGVVLAVLDTDRLPQLHLCHRLLRNLRMGNTVHVERRVAERPHRQSAVTVLTAVSGESVDCLGPSGIPLAHSVLGSTWRAIDLEIRRPTDAEIGVPLVKAEAVLSGGAVCRDPGPEPGAGLWLADVAEHAAGYPAMPRDGGVGLEVPGGARWRPAFSWVTAANSHALPSSTRRRLLSDHVVAEELLRPGPVVSIQVDDLRIWVAFAGELDRPWPGLERDAFVLGEVARRLASAAAVHPYDGEALEDACFSLKSLLTFSMYRSIWAM